jgi:hypothetical protein
MRRMAALVGWLHGTGIVLNLGQLGALPWVFWRA